MITLPTAVTTSAKTSSTATISTGAGSDAAVDTSGGELSSGKANSQQGFLTLLGNRLLSLTQQGSGPATGETVDGAVASENDNAAKKPGISDLLAALDKPEALTALLQPAQMKTDTKAEADSDDKTAPAVKLSNSDLETLQALFAMLPANIAVPAAGSAEKSSDMLITHSGKSDKQSTLNALSAALGQVTSEEGDDDGLSVAVNAKSSDTSGTGKTTVNPAATSIDPAFQQVMSNAGKDIDKENSSSAPHATITNNVISAASSPLTPVSTWAVSAPATPLLNSQLGSPEWQQALGQQILMFSRNGQQTAELHLHPQDLGSIQISLKLDNDQAQLNMVSNHSQVRAALEAALPQLRASMAESGINLGQSNVSSDAFQQGQSFSGQQEQQRNNNGTPFSLATENDSSVTPIAVPNALQARATGSSAVDIFA